MIWDYILSDLGRIAKPDLFSFFKCYLFPSGTTFRYQVWFRIVQGLKIRRIYKFTLAPIPYLILRHYEFKYGIHMNTNIKVGKGLLIVHGGSVYVNVERIGENFTIFQNMTLGVHGGETKRR